MVIRDRFLSVVSRISLSWLAFTLLASCKISLILGSVRSFFTLTSLTTPLVGVGQEGLLVATLLTICRFSFRILTGGHFGWRLFAFIIPGWAASCYWSIDSIASRVIIPLASIVLFICHPVGWYAAPYALYWLIPVVLCFLPTRFTFATALGATFTAHAVGSVIWLYATPTTIAMWYQLIPIVAIERICFAVGMTLVAIISDSVQQRFDRWYLQTKVVKIN